MPPLLFAQFPFFQFLMHVRSLLHTIRSDTLDDDGSGVNLLPRDRKHFPERVFPDLSPRDNFTNYSLLTSMPITSFEKLIPDDDRLNESMFTPAMGSTVVVKLHFLYPL